MDRNVPLEVRTCTLKMSGFVVAVFRHGWDPFPPFIATLRADDWHAPCFQSFGIIPVHAGVHACVFELALHSWDIRSRHCVKPVW